MREYIIKIGLEGTWELHENEHNQGYIRNFYKAISLCDTDLVFLSDQDDIWKDDKIEKMSEILEQKNNISLLSCKYAIINAQDEQQHSLVETTAVKEDGKIQAVNVESILRAYHWPGMVMCIRKNFFDEIFPKIDKINVAHDFMFAYLAADTDGFYEYNYIGAYHRRHENNTAREEHRVFKLLNLKKKLEEILITEKLWETFLNSQLQIKQKSKEAMERRLLLLKERKIALEQKSFPKIVGLYWRDKGKSLRVKSFICDIWLVLFGKKI